MTLTSGDLTKELTLQGLVAEKGSAQGEYLDIQKYATLDASGWQNSDELSDVGIKKVYDWTEDVANLEAWLTIPAATAALGGMYDDQMWIGFGGEPYLKDITWSASAPFKGSSNYYNSGGQCGRAWDQSNWVAFKFPADESITTLFNGIEGNKIKAGTVTGCYIDNSNYTIEVQPVNGKYTLTFNGTLEYTPNVYCCANFVESNLNIGGNTGAVGPHGDHYFFMNPKIQEICEVTYAQWDAINGYFTVPTSSGFDGAFYIGTGYNVIQSQNFTSSLQDEHIYKFKAIVQRSDKDNYGPKNVTTPATGITLYPVDLDPASSEIPTAINTIRANGEVVGVEYVNSLGIVSKTPFQGVNIVVTRYSNGATTTSKKVFK